MVTRRYGRHGNSFVKVIEFGPSVRGRSVVVFGESGDPASPHFFDQAPLYAERRFKPAWFTREEMEASRTGRGRATTLTAVGRRRGGFAYSSW